MKIHCKSCGRVIHPDHINLERALAKCSNCNIVFSTNEHFGAEFQTVRSLPKIIPIPGGIEIKDDGRDFLIIRKWFSPIFIYYAIACVFWDSSLIFWYNTAFNGEAYNDFMLFSILHGLVGISLTYFTVAGFFNITEIRVKDNTLSIKHGPLPWPGNMTVSTSGLDQLYCTEHKQYQKNLRVRYFYRLNALLQNGKKITLLNYVHQAEQVLAIEALLEKHLGIKDRRVVGEFPH